MRDFEKLGVFYLGKNYDLKRGELGEAPVLYDSKDLTTHAVIIGMTGSGKTGLGVGLIEEAALDNIPVLAIDPKGDLANLMLTFPKLEAGDFRPWINPQEAATKGKTPEAYAQAQAELWRKGLKAWGQDGERIERLKRAAEVNVYTPGSSAGRSVSVLKSFSAPPTALKEDGDLYRERISATATSILALLDIEADPITSREHILLSTLLGHAWDEDRDLDLAGLIAAIQQPPVERVGVMDLDTFFPPKDRFKLAMNLNNLLASPGFESWMEGEPLSAKHLLYSPEGRPRMSVMSIAHLSDSERMFFVTMLLNELIAWMRTQSGTGGLRAILYIDELFGYMPPTANPPSKTPLLTLLKQARAYGLGLVLSTQNPVDLDYKGLSNTGTWFIGRLQTERDKARVLEGLEGAAAGGGFDKQTMEQTLAGLGKRVFLLHNVHENEPLIFHTRWVMSYLAGPMTREQIKRLMADKKPAPESLDAGSRPVVANAARAEVAQPSLPPDIKQLFVPLGRRDDGELVYAPRLAGAAELIHSSTRYKVESEKQLMLATEVDDGPIPVDWEVAEPLEFGLNDLESRPAESASFMELPAPMTKPKNYSAWEKLFKRYLRTEQVLRLYRSPELKRVSEVAESEAEFRVRLRQLSHEQRDLEKEKLRKKYASKMQTLRDRVMRAEQRLERESEQVGQRRLETAVSVGTALLGAFVGRKTLSKTSLSKASTAVRSVGRMQKESGDVERAEETLASAQQQLRELESALERDLEALAEASDGDLELEDIVIKPKSTDIHIQLVGVVWIPYLRASDGRLRPA